MKDDPNKIPNRIKGAIAESLIKELAIEKKYEVYPFGIEHTMPRLANVLEKREHFGTQTIASFPDFVLVKKREGVLKSYFVEVKYRKDGDYDFLQEYGPQGTKMTPYPFPQAIFVIVSRKNIEAQQAEKLAEGESFQPLDEIFSDEFDAEIVQKYVAIGNQFISTRI